ncbi:septation protein IspZ [Sphingobium boeckii]|uniref:Inner membrane-spanning protein YciB n=1 Tax=Sphingobium boeckii TaxID=1082345 RepID=A0A7W9AK65_9SPHN|nr:septation protein IspZ [Sphingobium boeckii]MBB5687175.1 intracellular septation protein [Sphingobium boeckii]
MTTSNVAEKKPGWLGFALDFGPLLIFFLTYRLNGPVDNPVQAIKAITAGTGAFMVAIVAALLISKIKLGKISPMLWISAALVLGFGGLTIYFHDQRFIQIKPTIIYLLFAGGLFFGVATKRPLLKYLLQAAYDGLDDAGWMKLTRNWAIFFLAMAGVNEAIRASFDFDTWLTLKVWGVTILSFLFAIANVPMMMKHGLDVGADDVAEQAPPQG